MSLPDILSPPERDFPDLDRPSAAGRRPPDGEPPPTRKEALVSRLWRAAERQVEQVERRSLALPGAGSLEQDAKTLAVLCRVIKELPPEEDEAAKARAKAQAEADEDGSDRDLEAFREDLARQLDRLQRDGAGEGASEPFGSAADRPDPV